MEEIIKLRWNDMTPEEKVFVKDNAMRLMRRQGFILVHINFSKMQAFFSAIWQKLDLPKNPKTRFLPKNSISEKQKLDFYMNLVQFLGFLAPNNLHKSQFKGKINLKAHSRALKLPKKQNLDLKC